MEILQQVQTVIHRFKRKRKQVIIIKEEESKPRIIHTMADGTVRDSIEGHMVPVNESTKIFYMLMANHTIEKKNN